MILRRFALTLLILCLLATFSPTQPARAARGVPGSSEFGFAAHLNLSGSFSLGAVHLANNLELDWLAVDSSWKALAPKSGAVDWSRLDPVLRAASSSQLAVMLSLSQPPDWALGPQGPDPAKTAQFVVELVQKYPIIRAIELFPGANTAQGWGRPPSAQAYVATWKAVQSALQSSKKDVLLVTGGLQPTAANLPPAQAVSDLTFLQDFYTAAKVTAPIIISMQAGNLTGEPLQAPNKSENRVLRHYEEIRAVMTRNKQDAGLIWITHLSPPNGSIAANDRRYQDIANQTTWWSQAYDQMKSQLYIGVAFLGQINPGSSEAPFSLLLPSGDYHPFYRSLRDRISVNRSNKVNLRPGRAKAEPLQKNSQGKK